MTWNFPPFNHSMQAVPGDDLDQQVQSLARHSVQTLVQVLGIFHTFLSWAVALPENRAMILAQNRLTPAAKVFQAISLKE